MNKQNIALNIEGLTKVYKNGVEAEKGVDLQVHATIKSTKSSMLCG